MHHKPLCLGLLLSVLLALPVSGYDMTISGTDQADFARPTSDDTIYVAEGNNQDLSKDTAVVPPGLTYTVSPTVGTALNPYAVTWGTNSTVTTATTTSVTTMFTSVTSSLYDTNGSLGTLSIPAVGLHVSIYEGTEDDILAKGIGHFETTSIWNGNVCLAGHNRGVTTYFGEIHTLSVGDFVMLETAFGTRTYSVSSVTKVSKQDSSMLSATSTNQLTLITCVANESGYRWVVTATAYDV